MSLALIVLIIASFVAGAQNALAGGGSFLTFPALLYAGLDPRAANITSAIALFPGQITTGIAGRSMLSGAAGLSIRTLFILSLVGGGIGAVLLLLTPVSVFTHLVPFLVLFATVVFAWGSFIRKAPPPGAPPAVSPRTAAILQFLIAIYGGYFGGGIGILMLAAFTAAGLAVRHAGATKNVLCRRHERRRRRHLHRPNPCRMAPRHLRRHRRRRRRPARRLHAPPHQRNRAAHRHHRHRPLV